MSDLWWRITKMKKEAKSPAAKERKRKYETQYESTPARKKYRRELERERRKRGVAGKGGKDMSHTKTGTIVPEDPHKNRARSHPSVGSTLKMVVKAPLYDTVTGKQVAGEPMEMPDFSQGGYQFAFDRNMNNPYDPPKSSLIYVSPDKSAAAQVELPHRMYADDEKLMEKVRRHERGKGPRATVPLFGVHYTQRGKGKGREALRGLKEELREFAPEVKRPVEPVGVGGGSFDFWDKMHEEGLAHHDIDQDTEDTLDFLLGVDRDEDDEDDPYPIINTGEPMDIVMRLLKEQKKLFVQGQKTLDGRPAFMPTDFAAEEQRRQAALKEQRAREAREAQRRKNAEGLIPLPHFQQNSE